MRTARRIVLEPMEELHLRRLLRSKTTPRRLAQRVRVVLLAARDLKNQEIAKRLNIGRAQAARWRNRFAERRLDGIQLDAQHRRRRLKLDLLKLVTLTTAQRGAADNQWSTRSMAEQLGVSAATVSRHWRNHGLRQTSGNQAEIWRDAELLSNLEDVVGVYLSPASEALALRCANPVISKAQASQQPIVSGADDARRSTQALLAALGMLDAASSDSGVLSAQHLEWLQFLRRLDQDAPVDKYLYLICSGYSTLRQPDVRDWLSQRPSFRVFVAAGATAWLEMVQQLVKRLCVRHPGEIPFSSVAQLIPTIRDYIAQSENPRAFVWIKPERSIRAARRSGAHNDDSYQSFTRSNGDLSLALQLGGNDS